MAESDFTDDGAMNVHSIRDGLDGLERKLRGVAAIFNVLRDTDEDALPQDDDRMHMFWLLSMNIEDIAEKMGELNDELRRASLQRPDEVVAGQ